MSLAVVCSGQGGQHAAMFDAIEAAGEAHPSIAQASGWAGFDVVAALRAPAERVSMFDNAIAQPLICAYQGIVWSVLESRLDAVGLSTSVVAGYSVGELAAYGCAHGLSWADVVALARLRASLMDGANPPDAGLLAVRGPTRAGIDASLAAHRAFLAIVNGADQFIVGGHAAALAAVADDVIAHGGTAQRLSVAVAAHTPLLADAVAPFRAALGDRTWTAPRVPVLAGLDGSAVRDPTRAIDLLSRQIAGALSWMDCMDGLVERGVTTCLELGPGNALARMMRERHPDVATRSVADFRSIDGVVEWVVRAAQ